jgi:hypothetical protein
VVNELLAAGAQGGEWQGGGGGEERGSALRRFERADTVKPRRCSLFIGQGVARVRVRPRDKAKIPRVESSGKWRQGRPEEEEEEEEEEVVALKAGRSGVGCVAIGEEERSTASTKIE